MRTFSRRRAVRFLAALIGSNAVSARLPAAIPAEKAVYRGGTVSSFEPPARGELFTNLPAEFVFAAEQDRLTIPYGAVNSLEYGQKAGRRLGMAIIVSPLFLLSKKRRHYLTIGYIDQQGEQQAAVFELGKRIVRSTLAALEAKTGLRVEYEDEKARQAARR